MIKIHVAQPPPAVSAITELLSHSRGRLCYTLSVQFDDGLDQVIDFEPVLTGHLFGPLKDLELFNEVTLDREVHTLVWPSGADFDPATLHDWPEHLEELKLRVRQWELAATS